MKRKPKISVIMPLYNAEVYIERTLNSILSQSYDDFEVIMIDDCPKDRTVEIVNSFNDTRLRIIHNVRNEGIAFSRNRGIEFSNGEYIALMDHDDIALPYRFEKQVEFLEQNRDIAIVGGGTQWIDAEDNPLTEPTTVTQNPNELRARILFYNIYWNCEVMFRRSVAESGIRYHSGCYGMEDFRFWIEASTKFKMSNIPELVLKHREVETSETNRVKREANEEKNRMFEKLREHSLTLSGYHLNEEQWTILNKVLPENRTGYCSDDVEKRAFCGCMQAIVHQAEEMKVEYLTELKQICTEFVREKTGEDSGWYE